jgi:hypothetical protein
MAAKVTIVIMMPAVMVMPAMAVLVIVRHSRARETQGSRCSRQTK